MATLTLESVTKTFRDGTVAVADVDLTVPDGVFCVLVGPSGCGKTTVLRLVSGLERVTGGTIWLGGEDVTEDAPRDRDVAMVFQNYALYPHLNVYDNIAFGLRNRRVHKDEVRRRVEAASVMLGLNDVVNKRPKWLSGGQRQRVALGRAIVREPQIFLMDEPLSNLDAKLRDQMRTELLRIQKALDVTTLYVTHDHGEAMTLGQIVGVMDDGRVRQIGTPQAIYEHPADLFVAGFMGMPPMNLVESTIERRAGSVVARFGPYELDLGARPVTLAEGQRRQAVLGVRPEHIDEAVGEPRPGRTLEVLVERRELLGAEVYLRFSVGAPLLLVRDPRDAGDEPAAPDVWAAERPNAFVARVDASSDIREGDRARLRVRTEKVHLFDAETEAALA
jgi:multiple sugar transport system ATP-binding protein